MMERVKNFNRKVPTWVSISVLAGIGASAVAGYILTRPKEERRPMMAEWGRRALRTFATHIAPAMVGG